MLRFAHPEYLYWLWLVPVLAAGAGAVYWHRKRLLAQFLAPSIVAQVAPEANAAKRFIKQGLFLAAVACLILAAANPQVGTRLEEVKRRGIDLYVALDVSLSMKSEDIRPSRLEKAKRDISNLLKKLQGDRVGLIVFAGEAFVQFPLTSDYSAADLFLSAADVDAVPLPGTMIGSAIEMALKSFPQDVPTTKAIVVVTDGENTEGDVLGAVEKAKAAGVRIYCIGQGTPEGGPIPVGGANDFKRDNAGSIVLTKLDESMLQQIASATGGSYRRATSGGDEIEAVFKEISSLEKTDFGQMQIAGFKDQFQIPLAIGLLLLLAEFLLSERRGLLMKRIARLFAAGAVIAAVLAVPGALQAQTVRSHVAKGNDAYKSGKFSDAETEYKKAMEKDGKSREARYNLGNAEYKQQRLDEALRSYDAAMTMAKNPGDQANAYYNMGNALLKGNKFAESIEAYKRALRLNPDDEDARYNLQMARRMMQQQQQQQKKQDQKDKNKDQNKDQNKQDQQQNKDQQQQQQKQPQQNQQQAKADQTQQQQQKKEQMKKDEAERILQTMKDNERDLQKKLRKRVPVRVRVEKDW